MINQQIEKALQAFDLANAKDPNIEVVNGIDTPKELIYGQRMTTVLQNFEPTASTALQLAARCQHICRWESPRSDYEMNRVGYLKWRADLKKFHAKKASCLVFLEYYYEAFRLKHTDEKVIDIIQKTWKKMSEKGHQAALRLNYSEPGLSLIQKALA